MSFKSTQGKKEILDLYDEKLRSLQIDTKSTSIDTKYGNTHVIMCGEEHKPPLMIVHGSNGCAPISLETYPNLTSKYKVYAVDVVGQPNKSDYTTMRMKDNSYGEWLNEVLTKLNLKDVTLVGFSLGGMVILKTLIHDQTKIKSATLAAPAFIVNGNPLKALFKIFIPMKRYMGSKKIKFVEKFLNELFTDRDEFAVRYLSKVFLYFNLDFSPLPVISKYEGIKISTPITLFAAQDDLLFPGEKMIKKAKNVFPSLTYSVLLQNSKHVQGRKDNDLIEKQILENSN